MTFPVLPPIPTRHPINKGLITNTIKRMDFDIWCGATFVYNIRTLFEEQSNTDVYSLIDFQDITSIKNLPKNKEVVLNNYTLLNKSVDSIILNIRTKTNSWTKLGKILWSMEYPPEYIVGDDRPLSISDSSIVPIEISANLTAIMSDHMYSYELIFITSDFVINEISIKTDDVNTFSYKHLVQYGNITTHQIGEL